MCSGYDLKCYGVEGLKKYTVIVRIYNLVEEGDELEKLSKKSDGYN